MNELDQSTLSPAIAAPASDRAAFLRRTGLWTMGGLAVTAVTALASAVFVAPAILPMGTIAVLVAVYGSLILSQTAVRGMVYGGAKVAGFVLGTALQGVALGFLLLVTLLLGAPAEGLTLIGYCVLITLLTGAAMTVYLWDRKRELSLVGAGLAMMGLPLLVVMGLQLVFPFQGVLGIVVTSVFLLVAVGGLLWRLNKVLHEFDTRMHVEAGYEVTLGLVVVFWNLLSLVNRLRGR